MGTVTPNGAARATLGPGRTRREWLHDAYRRVTTTSPLTRRLVAGGLALVVGLTLYRDVLPDDFAVYREAGAQLLRDPSRLYAEGTGLPFTYPPVAAVLFLALALVPGWLGATVVRPARCWRCCTARRIWPGGSASATTPGSRCQPSCWSANP